MERADCVAPSRGKWRMEEGEGREGRREGQGRVDGANSLASACLQQPPMAVCAAALQRGPAAARRIFACMHRTAPAPRMPCSVPCTCPHTHTGGRLPSTPCPAPGVPGALPQELASGRSSECLRMLATRKLRHHSSSGRWYSTAALLKWMVNARLSGAANLLQVAGGPAGRRRGRGRSAGRGVGVSEASHGQAKWVACQRQSILAEGCAALKGERRESLERNTINTMACGRQSMSTAPCGHMWQGRADGHVGSTSHAQPAALEAPGGTCLAKTRPIMQ